MFKNLLKRNTEQSHDKLVNGAEYAGDGHDQTSQRPDDPIHMPFILVSTDPSTRINCQVTEDK